jgi:hypothetical protein
MLLELGIAFHIIFGMICGAGLQKLVDEHKYTACVYKERKADLKEYRENHLDEIKECEQ